MQAAVAVEKPVKTASFFFFSFLVIIFSLLNSIALCFGKKIMCPSVAAVKAPWHVALSRRPVRALGLRGGKRHLWTVSRPLCRQEQQRPVNSSCSEPLLLTFATGEKMVLRLVGKVRAARDLFRNYSSNLPLLSFGSFANPAFISDIFPWLLLFLMAQ